MESKDKVSTDVVASWTSVLGPLIASVNEETAPEGLSTSEAAFKASRSAQNWSAATGVTQTEAAVNLEALETLDPDTSAAQHSTAQHSTTQHRMLSTAKHSIAQHSMAP